MGNESYEKRGYLLEDFRLFHLRGAQGVKAEYHYHEFCKLLLLISGSGGYSVEGQRYNLQPGDIVFFANTYGSGISHVGIYSGNGQFIHSPNSRSVVSYSDLVSGYWANHYYGARRIG